MTSFLSKGGANERKSEEKRIQEGEKTSLLGKEGRWREGSNRFHFPRSLGGTNRGGKCSKISQP